MSLGIIKRKQHSTVEPQFKDAVYSLLCQLLIKMIIVINPVCVCARMSAQDDDFQMENGGKCVPNDFVSEVLCFGLSDITLLWVSLGL